MRLEESHQNNKNFLSSKQSWSTNYNKFSLIQSWSGQNWLHSRDEHWTGLGLDWIRTFANFVEFRLHSDCKTLLNLRSRADLDSVNGKEIRHFCCENAAFLKYFGLHLDLDFTYEKIFGLCLDLDWVLKYQDWNWIAQYDHSRYKTTMIWQSTPLCFSPDPVLILWSVLISAGLLYCCFVAESSFRS